jgi:hypothetical protein
MEGEVSKEKGALMFVAQALDKGLSKGAYNRTEVLDYNQALIILNEAIEGLEPKEE